MRRIIGTFGLIALVALVTVFFWEDAPLDPAAAARLQTPPRLPREVNVFYPLVGFEVAVGEDPATAGYEATTRMNAVLENAGAEPPSGVVEAAWVTPSVTIEDPDGLLCALWETECIATLVMDTDAIVALAARNRILLERYAALNGFPAFQTEVSPHVSAPFPRFRTLIEVHRLWLGERLVAHLGGDAGALDRIHADLRFHRRLLATADTLIVKMIAASLLADALHAFAAAMDGPGVNPSTLPKLPVYGASERSLDAALTGEFRMSVSTISDLHEHPGFYRDLGLPESVSPVLLRPLFKPNRSVNLAWRCFELTLNIVRRTRRTGAAPQSTVCEPDWVEWALNPIGAILITVSAPELGRYGLRLDDLGGLIALVNLKRAIREAGIDEAGVGAFVLGPGQHVIDPSTGKVIEWDADGGAMWFESADPNATFNRLALSPLG